MSFNTTGALQRPQVNHRHNIQSLIPRHPGTYVTVPERADLPAGVEGDNWALFIAMLSLHTSLSKERQKQGHWINFHNATLRSLIGGKYAQRVGNMIEAGLIERNNSYSHGIPAAAHSMSYRLSKPHRDGKFKLHRLSTKPAIRKVTKLREPDPDNLRPAGMFFQGSFDLFSLQIEADRDQSLSNFWDRWTVARWFNRETFSKRCEYGRYHSLMTQLPREMRRYLTTDDDEPLTIVDISSCQPLLLGMLAGRHYGGRSKSITQWIDLCQHGEFYNHFYEAVQRFDGPVIASIALENGQTVERDLRTISRKGFKKATLIPAFQKREAMEKSPVFQTIEREFPEIAGYMRWVKRERHQELACALQRAESSLMIDRLGKLLMKRHSDVPVQPIHDAIIVPEAFAEIAKELIEEVFRSVDLLPRVTNETLSG